ncbi:MAG: alkyl sulfatase dimerization domain-containing protein [Myxococcota bacterium]
MKRIGGAVAGGLAGVVVGVAIGLLAASTDAGRGAQRALRARVADAVVARAGLDARARLAIEHPEIMQAISRGGAFGGKTSPSIAQHMFAREGAGIDDARAMAETVEVAPRTWLIRLPIVNAVLFETDEGLVLVDTGMGPAGPAVREQMRKVSSAPLHTIIYTHGHVDHAYGTWALMDEGAPGRPIEVVANEKLPARFERYIRLRGSLAHYMSQPEDELPRTRDDLVWPTRTFSDRLELEIGGERFVLVHREGETDDQLYVWVPSRGALASADYYQGFLPNAGNGKRVQRNVEEWIVALREMVALEPKILLPAHNEAITDPAAIRENLGVLADALEHILDHTLDGLNRGLRKDQIFQSVELPPELANHPTLHVQYVTPKDVSKMILKRYTGWWDDVPSHWSPAPLEAQAEEIASLAGGIDALVARAHALVASDVVMACHLADWAFLAAPGDPGVQQLVIDAYLARIVDPRSNTQEMLAYLDVMARARELQLAAGR